MKNKWKVLVALVALVSVATVWGRTQSASVEEHEHLRREVEERDRTEPSHVVTSRREPDLNGEARRHRGPPEGYREREPERSNVHERYGRAISSLFREWSNEKFETLFGHAPPERLQEPFDWYAFHLGECEAEFTVLATRDRTRARYSLACENGLLEAEPLIDESGHVQGILTGARGLDPVDSVERAAAEVMRLLHEWDDHAYVSLFCEGFVRDSPPSEFRLFLDSVREECGVCERGTTDLVNPRGAIFFLSCECGHRIMVLDLDDDDRIRRFLVRPPRAENPAPDRTGRPTTRDAG